MPLACPGRLLARNRYAHTFHTVAPRGVRHEAAPAAADVEHAHAWFEAKLAADQVELGHLRLRQRMGIAPVATGVRHRRVEHRFVEVVAEVVVRLADLPRAAAVLAVAQFHLQRVPGKPHRLHPAIEVGAKQAVEEPVQLLAVPGTRHVGLAEAEVALGQCAIQHGRIMQLHIPRPVAVDLDISAGKQVGDQLAGGVFEAWPRDTPRRFRRIGVGRKGGGRWWCHGTILRQSSRPRCSAPAP